MAGLLSIGTLLSDRYEVIRVLGQGGMGAVYLVTDRRLSVKQWAVKETVFEHKNEADHDALEKLFVDEAHILARLDHPNLPKVVDFFSEGDRKYLVMEFIEGNTLETEVLKEQSYLPLGTVIHYALQIADVLDYLHNQKPSPIIFRDLKPANVMITREGRVKLIDFGIARLFVSGKDVDTVILGTPGYAPPEQYGKAQTDEKSDIFSLGATLYFALTREDPGKSPFHFPPVRNYNSGVPKELEDAVLKMVSLAPGSRYAGMKEIIFELKRISPENRSLFTTPLPQNAPDTAVPIEFKPPVLDFGTLKRGSIRSVSVTLTGTVKGNISVDKRWLTVKPSSVKGVNPVIDAVVNTNLLQHGGNFLAHAVLKTRNSTHTLPVSVKIETQPLSFWSYLVAFLLTSLSFLPVIGFIGFFFMLWLYYSVPAEDRGSMWVFLIISSVISILWLLTIFVVLAYLYFPKLRGAS